MSSNMSVKRLCEWCGSEFLAKTTVTHYCSGACNKRAYEALARQQKIEINSKFVELPFCK
jgi:hypothetical protein